MDFLPALLCPITDFPFMLPECVPVGPVLIASTFLPLAALIALARQRARARDGKRLGQIQLRGVVCCGPGGTILGRPSFVLRTTDGEVLVSVTEDAVRGRPLVAGSRVAVTGIDGMIDAPGERLFREPARQAGIDAIEIRSARWGWLGWLVPTVAITTWLAFVIALLALTPP